MKKKKYTCGDCFRCEKATAREKDLCVPDVCRMGNNRMREVNRNDPECAARTGERELEEKLKKREEVYVLMCDDWGSTFSKQHPLGIAVVDEKEAKRYEKEGHVGFAHSYVKVRIFENKDDGIAYLFPKVKENM